jgi:hypothetical protein
MVLCACIDYGDIGMFDQTGVNDKRVLKIVGHSKIIYWWPVWVFGYSIALIGYFVIAHVSITANERLDLAVRRRLVLIASNSKDAGFLQRAIGWRGLRSGCDGLKG